MINVVPSEMPSVPQLAKPGYAQMMSDIRSDAGIRPIEQEERERRSSRRNLAGILIVTFVSLGLIIGDIIRDISQR